VLGGFRSVSGRDRDESGEVDRLGVVITELSSGRIWLETGEQEQGWIQLGDLALVPHGDGHVLRSGPGVPAPGSSTWSASPVSDRYEILRHCAGGAPTSLICGAVGFAHPARQQPRRDDSGG
jgi:hypothetical protein